MTVAGPRRKSGVRATKELAWMRERWAHIPARDPAYNPNLSLETADFDLAWPPRIATPW
ncbi:MAG: hypothetical protein M1399_03710 [Actinobacteria bacterium]|nr:hypothetical protein [Actinomycetota bacterium]